MSPKRKNTSLSPYELQELMLTHPDAPRNIASALKLAAGRRASGVMNPADALEQASILTQYLKHLSEHAYVKYLIELKRYDELVKLLWALDTPKHLINFRDELRHEHADKQHLLEEYLAVERTIANMNKAESKRIAAEHKKTESSALANLEIYQYLCSQHEQIHHDFHMEHIELYQTAYTHRVSCITEAMEVLGIDEHDETHPLAKLKRLFVEEYRQNQLMEVTYPDGSVNFSAVRAKHDRLKAWDAASHDQLIDTLRTYANTSDEISLILHRFIESKNQIADQIAVSERLRNDKLSEIAPYLGQAQQATKNDILSEMGAWIGILEGSNQAQNAVTKELIACRDQLSASNDQSQISHWAGAFLSQLDSLKNRVGLDDLVPELRERLNTGLELLSRAAHLSYVVPSSLIRNSFFASAPAPDPNPSTLYRAELAKFVTVEDPRCSVEPSAPNLDDQSFGAEFRRNFDELPSIFSNAQMVDNPELIEYFEGVFKKIGDSTDGQEALDGIKLLHKQLVDLSSANERVIKAVESLQLLINSIDNSNNFRPNV